MEPEDLVKFGFIPEFIGRLPVVSSLAELSLDDSVFLEGFAGDVHKAIQDAEMFVLSSDYEGTPNALLEAMMMGLPCVTTSFEGADELYVLRLHETFLERIQKTAKAELHTNVVAADEPMEIRPIIAKEFRQRSHHITFVYACQVPSDYRIDNGTLEENDSGYLAWHEKCPNQLLKCHEFYRKYFEGS